MNLQIIFHFQASPNLRRVLPHGEQRGPRQGLEMVVEHPRGQHAYGLAPVRGQSPLGFLHDLPVYCFFFKCDACFCQQPAWALLDFSAFPFCLLYLLLILFGGCRSTRRSSARSLPAQRRTSGAPSPTATSRWSTRGASVTIYLYVTKTTTADRRLSEPDLHNNCFGFFKIFF